MNADWTALITAIIAFITAITSFIASRNAQKAVKDVNLRLNASMAEQDEPEKPHKVSKKS